MKLTASRQSLLAGLGAVIGVVERRQTMPILANVLLVAKSNQLAITATDIEVELQSQTDVDVDMAGEVTVPGRKLFDIVKALPDSAEVKLTLKGDRLTVQSGRSRFSLSTLPAIDFPIIDDIDAAQSVELPVSVVHRLLNKTYFAMAQQDVRYYLNGMLIETDGGVIRAVATDGHRLALCESAVDGAALPAQQVIVPRKGVLELQRMLGDDGSLSVEMGKNHIRISTANIRFTSKLIDGRFPDYQRVIPSDTRNFLTADRDTLRTALQRAAILSNEKYRGIRLEIRDSGAKIMAHNPEQEEAEEEVEVEYSGDDIEIGFNVNYLLDALGAVDDETVRLSLNDANSSCVISIPDIEKSDSKYVVMPMRL
ncbi:MAG: DNA polymerase III subunit beta [Pseudomonadota bacterium]